MAGLVAGLGLTSVDAPSALAAPMQQTEWHIAVGRLPLNEALMQLARQMDIAIARFSDVGSGQIVVGPVSGRYSRDEALRLLLHGTGLTYRFVNDHTVAIMRETGPATGAPGVPQAQAITPSPTLGATEAGTVNNKGSESVSAKPAKPKHRSFWSRFLCLIAVCGTASLQSSHVHAQQAAADPPAAQQTADAGQAPMLTQLQEVTVTGSRVITNSSISPTPVTSVSVQQLQQLNPGLASSGLAQVPAVQATPSQAGDGTGAGQAVFNLRGLGATRNLILFDGHRVAATTPGVNGGVDTNLIPQMLLQRVDVVTGGASAVYGSDAVSGVLNYVINHNFNGLEVTGQRGESTYQDDKRWNGGLAAGTSLFGGRGHIEASVQFFNDPGVSSRFTRSWGNRVWTMVGSVPAYANDKTKPAGSALNPYLLIDNARFSGSSFGGLINSGPLAGLQFAQNGVLSPFVNGAPTGSSTIQIGGDGAYYTDEPAWIALNMGQGFGRFDYTINDNLKSYVELAVGSATYAGGNLHGNENVYLNNVSIGYNNAYLAGVTGMQPQYQATIASELAADPLGSFKFGKMTTPEDNFPAQYDTNHEAQDLVIAGLEGLWGPYKWTFSYEWQRSTSQEQELNTVSYPRLYAALNAVVDPATGQTVCNAALVNPSAYGNCVPLNVFGPSASSQAAFNYIAAQTEAWTTYGMNDVTASLVGSPVSDWAGPIDMAWSADWRRLTYGVTSDALPTAAVDCTGIQFNCTANTTAYYYGSTAAFPTASEGVAELAYETEIPLLKNVPLAKSLELNGAARFTHYTQSGSVWTWKLGTTWDISDAFTVRVTRSYDIRAPGLSDLYAPATYGTFPLLDLHTGASGIVTTITQGNPNLKPEKANTWTAGFVWKPQVFDGGKLSLDFYHINIGDALLAVTPTQPATEAACDSSGGSSPVCALLVRPHPFSDASADNYPTLALSEELNTAYLVTYGVDGELDYQHVIAGHNFGAHLLMNYQPHLIYNQGPAGSIDVGDAADGIGGLAGVPSVRGTLNFNFGLTHDLSLMMQERYRNGMKQNGSTLLYFGVPALDAAYYTDATLSYDRATDNGSLSLFFNVRNLFNRQPQPWASSGANGQIGALGGFSAIDDPLGRYFTLGVRYRID